MPSFLSLGSVVPFFCTPVPGCWDPGNIRQNHPFGNHPFANPRTLGKNPVCISEGLFGGLRTHMVHRSAFLAGHLKPTYKQINLNRFLRTHSFATRATTYRSLRALWGCDPPKNLKMSLFGCLRATKSTKHLEKVKITKIGDFLKNPKKGFFFEIFFRFRARRLL